MLSKLKSGGTALLGFVFIVALLAVVGLLIEGAGWITAKIYPWIQLFAVLAVAVLFLVLLPLSAFKKTRTFAATSTMYVSLFLGLRLWMDGLLTTLAFWGVGGVVVGLFLAGVGVVPVGMLAALFHAEWARLFDLIIFTALTFGARYFAFWLAAKIDRDAELEAQRQILIDVPYTLDQEV
ncbi:MAG: hypothetical protein JST61_16230 [Acidobacteria bacterium]|nr:hypothetical protein [Acidobacteriota bacterium]